MNRERIWKEEVLTYFRTADLLFGTLLEKGRKTTSHNSYSSRKPCPDSNRMPPDPPPSIFLAPPFIIIQPVFFHS
jgi:hypothetical protein